GDAVKEVTVKDPPKDFFKGNVKNPTVFDSADELAKAFKNEDTLAAIKKEVDFKKQKLLVFGWSGSGGDKLAFTTGKEKVTFQYTPGKTRDLRQHFHAYVLPKELKYEVATGN